MKHLKRNLLFVGLAIVVVLAGACAPAATPAPTPVPPKPTESPTEAPPEVPTEVPTEVPPAPPAPTGFQLNDRIKGRVAAGEKLVFRLSYVDPGLEFAQEVIRGINDAAEDFGVDAKMVGPTPIDTAKQLAEIETLVEQGIDGLGVTSIDDAIFVPVMDRIIEQGIPVVTFNVDSPTSKRLGYFGQDNYLGAVAAGEEMMKYLGDDPTGKVAILSHDPSFSSLQDRAQGLTDVYSKYPGLELLGVFGNCGSDVDLCYSVIENLYTQHSDIKVMHAVDGVTTPTLARFMEKEGLKGQVFTAGWDLVPDSLQGVKRGDLLFTEGQYPYKFGYWAVEALYKAAHGGPAESRDVGAEIVDATNVDKYLVPGEFPSNYAETPDFELNDRIKGRVAAGEKLVFRLSYVDPGLEFAQEVIRGINDAAEDFGVDAKMVGPTPIDTAKQLAEIETLVEQGIDGLGVTSIDDAIFVPVMDRIIEQGIPVVTFNVDSPTSKRLGYFGQDNYLGAVAAGEEMMKYLGDDPTGKVAILSHDPSFSSLQDRAQGLTDVYSKYPGLELLGVFGNCGSDVDLCYSVIENLYTQHSDIKVMHAVDGVTTPTLARFMEKEGLKGQVFTAGWDLVPDSLQGVKRGDLLFTEGQYPYKFGYWAVEALYKAAHGGPAESRDVGAEIVDATNIDQYLQ